MVNSKRPVRTPSDIPAAVLLSTSPSEVDEELDSSKQSSSKAPLSFTRADPNNDRSLSSSKNLDQKLLNYRHPQNLPKLFFNEPTTSQSQSHVNRTVRRMSLAHSRTQPLSGPSSEDDDFQPQPSRNKSFSSDDESTSGSNTDTPQRLPLTRHSPNIGLRRASNSDNFRLQFSASSSIHAAKSPSFQPTCLQSNLQPPRALRKSNSSHPALNPILSSPVMRIDNRQLIVEETTMNTVPTDPMSLFKWTMANSNTDIDEDEQEQFLYAGSPHASVNFPASNLFSQTPHNTNDTRLSRISANSNQSFNFECYNSQTTPSKQNGLRRKKSHESRITSKTSHTLPNSSNPRTLRSLSSSETLVANSPNPKPANDVYNLKIAPLSQTTTSPARQFRNSRNHPPHNEMTFPGLEAYKLHNDIEHSMLMATQQHPSYHSIHFDPRFRRHDYYLLPEYEWEARRRRGRKCDFFSVCSYVLLMLGFLTLAVWAVGLQSLVGVKIKVASVNENRIGLIIMATNWNLGDVAVGGVDVLVAVGETKWQVEKWADVPIVRGLGGRNATGILSLDSFILPEIFPQMMEFRGTFRYTPPLALWLRLPSTVVNFANYQIPVCLEAIIEASNNVKTRPCFMEIDE
ncbi:hypothetical protein HK096_005694 [Nowakowskiella sp. JEL0078]|nr:hypothetical protein HK096_005694 [Nowakowskiella sp. JEL0078]